MSQRHHLAVVGAAATLLAAVPLGSIFISWTWMFYAALAVAFVVGAATLVRTARGPAWVQLLAMLGTLLLFVTWLFPSGGELLRLLPTPATFAHFNQLFIESGEQVRNEAIPVPDLDGILLLTTVGIGLVAMLVDLAAVGIRKPALAGLPMLAIYSVPVAVLPEGLSLFGFFCAAVGYIWLLVTDSVDRVRRFGRRFTGEGRDVDLWEPSPLAAAGRRLGVVGVAIAMLLPLAVPGMTSGLLERFGARGGDGLGSGTGSGTAGTVDLNAFLTGFLDRDTPIEMVRVTTNDPNPYYLRFAVADQITDAGFLARTPRGGMSLNRQFGDQPPSGPGVTVEQYNATINVVGLDMRLAPVYQQLVGINGLDGQWFYDVPTGQVFSGRASVDDKTYEVDYVRVSYTEAALRSAGAIPVNDTQLRVLSEVRRVPQVADRVTQLTAGKSNQYDQVRAIYDFFRPENGFTYEVSAEHGTSRSAIVDFLANRKGFCVQYAAAMAWLVRQAGYPARVAFGFTRGSGAQTGVSVLTNFNLHAWTEVYFAGFGWVPFDATPSASVVGSVRPDWAPGPPDPNASPGVDPGPETPGPSPGSPGAGGGVRDPNDPSVPGGGIGQINRLWFVGAAGVLVGLILFLTPSLHRGALRRRRRTRYGPTIVVDGERGAPRPAVPGLVVDPGGIATARTDAHAAWAELLDTMIDYRVPVDDAETPRATADRLNAMRSLRSTTKDVSLLAMAEERAEYARVPLHPDRLDDANIAVRKALAAGATRRERLSARWLPQSVVQRWRLVTVQRYTRLVGTAGRWRDAVVGVFSLRRLLAGRTR
jgi:transglutaminase-like putative cysteine protease